MIAVAASGVGSVYVPPLTAGKILLDKLPFVSIDSTWPDSWNTIIWQIRLPRIVMAGLVGACLAVSGATYQGLFRNPLADPYLIGVASGAGLGATVILVTSVPISVHGVSLPADGRLPSGPSGPWSPHTLSPGVPRGYPSRL